MYGSRSAITLRKALPAAESLAPSALATACNTAVSLLLCLIGAMLCINRCVFEKGVKETEAKPFYMCGR